MAGNVTLIINNAGNWGIEYSNLYNELVKEYQRPFTIRAIRGSVLKFSLDIDTKNIAVNLDQASVQNSITFSTTIQETTVTPTPIPFNTTTTTSTNTPTSSDPITPLTTSRPAPDTFVISASSVTEKIIGNAITKPTYQASDSYLVYTVPFTIITIEAGFTIKDIPLPFGLVELDLIINSVAAPVTLRIDALDDSVITGWKNLKVESTSTPANYKIDVIISHILIFINVLHYFILSIKEI